LETKRKSGGLKLELFHQFQKLTFSDQLQFIEKLLKESGPQLIIQIQEVIEKNPFNFFVRLPLEICLKIFSFLGLADLGALSQTSKGIRLILQNDYFWKQKYQFHFQMEPNGDLPIKEQFRKKYTLINNWRHSMPHIFTLNEQSTSSSPSSSSLVRGLKLIPKGDGGKEMHLVVCYYSGNYQIWTFQPREAENFQKIHEFSVEGTISCFDVSAWTHLMSVGCYNKEVKLIKLFSGKILQIYRQHFGPITSIAINHQYMVSGSSDHLILVYDLTTQEINSLMGHTGNVTALKFLNDTTLVSGSSDGKLIIWNLLDSESLMVLQDVGINDIRSYEMFDQNLWIGCGNSMTVCNLITGENPGQIINLIPILKLEKPGMAMTTSHGLLLCSGDDLHVFATKKSHQDKPDEILDDLGCIGCRKSKGKSNPNAKNLLKVVHFMASTETFLVVANIHSPFVHILDFS